jgi:two-component system, OmpR family, response regulator
LRILVVEDDAKMATLLRRGLVEEGLVADIAGTGNEALEKAAASQYDAVILDLMLPGIDGVSVCRRLRDEGTLAPVLMLTARGATEDRVAGLDAGADDYVTKPFVFAELLARLRALARRPPLAGLPVLEVGGLRLDPATHRVWRKTAEIALSAKEFALLQAFMRRPGEVLSRAHLLEQCWGDGQDHSNVVDAYVRYLRNKIDRPFGVASLETVRGAGYRLRVDGGSPVP